MQCFCSIVISRPVNHYFIAGTESVGRDWDSNQPVTVVHSHSHIIDDMLAKRTDPENDCIARTGRSLDRIFRGQKRIGRVKAAVGITASGCNEPRFPSRHEMI